MKKGPVKIWKSFSKKKKILITSISIVLVAAVVCVSVYSGKEQTMTFAKGTTQEATVTIGTISNTIVGTGTLATDASDSIKVPSGITIKEVVVESGDSVSKGDTLATVDKTSVLEAIETAQESIEELDEKIEEYKDSEDTTTLTAKVDGTIKKIYAKEGNSVIDCIAENGALLVISIDGTDDTMEITASGGTVAEISVSKKDQVSAGDALMTITNDEKSVEYLQAVEQRKTLVKELKQLVALSKTGAIVADIDGIVGDVNVSEGSDASSGSTNSKSSSAAPTSTSTKSSSSTAVNPATGSVATTVSTKTAAVATTLKSVYTSEITDTKEEKEQVEQGSKIQLAIAGTGKSSKDKLVIIVPKTGEKVQNEIEATDGYTGSIFWNPSVTVFEAGTTYKADVTLNATDGFVFGSDSIIQVESGLISGIQVLEQGKQLKFQITFPETEISRDDSSDESKRNPETESSSDKKNASDEKGTTDSSISQRTDSNSINSQNANTDASTSRGSVSASGNSGSTGSSIAGNSSSSASGTSKSEEATTTSSGSTTTGKEVTAFTLASNESMMISVSVDELDINSVARGQEATITMDAIEDKTFTGTVTKVGSTSSNSGNGVAKYTVEITIPKDVQMKVGMNASATIVIENRENVLTIPMNAIQEKGNQEFVYTSKDDEGNLSGEVNVTTGLSDGDNVEITEGLTEGQTVYYQRTGNTSDSGMGDFGGNMQERGERPDGSEFKGMRSENSGDMPQPPGQGGN